MVFNHQTRSGSKPHPSPASCPGPLRSGPRLQKPRWPPFSVSARTHAPGTRAVGPSPSHHPRHPRPTRAATQPSRPGVSCSSPARSPALTWPCASHRHASQKKRRRFRGIGARPWTTTTEEPSS